METVDSKRFKKLSSSIPARSLLITNIDLMKLGSVQTFIWFDEKEYQSNILEMITGVELRLAIKAHCERMQVPCSESIAEFSAQRDLYNALIKSIRKISPTEIYLVSSRTKVGRG